MVGDRFSHLIGAGAGKGSAGLKLRGRYQSVLPPDSQRVTVGLGNSPNDLDMLQSVDYPIVIPGHSGPHPQLAKQGWGDRSRTRPRRLGDRSPPAVPKPRACIGLAQQANGWLKLPRFIESDYNMSPLRV
ncbi:MAG: hypothetical protein AAGF66_10525 [Cyanobacteria bacterium P01_H01_bin.119]